MRLFIHSKNERDATGLSLAVLVPVLFTLLVIFGCGTQAGNPGEDDEKKIPARETVLVPDAAAIDLRGVGGSRAASFFAAAADGTSSCDSTKALGVFGGPVGAACFLSTLVQEMLYGKHGDRDGDGRLTCADYVPNQDDQGLLFPMLCEPGMLALKKVKSLRFSENAKTFAVSFEDFDAGDQFNALGHWTAGGLDTEIFPANMRVWAGNSSTTLPGLTAMRLKSGTDGWMAFDLNPAGALLRGESTFRAIADAAACEKTPGRETCHSQEFSISLPEDAVEGSIASSMRLTTLANKRRDPDFIVIEGKFRYSASVAEQLFGRTDLDPAFKQVRDVYMRVVQKGHQIWGSMDYKDASGQTIQVPVPGTTYDLTGILRNGRSNIPYAGVCQNLGSDQWVDCVDIDYKLYDALWVGDASYTVPQPNYQLPVSFGSAPTKDGIVQ